jgi:hypothetical protein
MPTHARRPASGSAPAPAPVPAPVAGGPAGEGAGEPPPPLGLSRSGKKGAAGEGDSGVGGLPGGGAARGRTGAGAGIGTGMASGARGAPAGMGDCGASSGAADREPSGEAVGGGAELRMNGPVASSPANPTQTTTAAIASPRRREGLAPSGEALPGAGAAGAGAAAMLAPPPLSSPPLASRSVSACRDRRSAMTASCEASSVSGVQGMRSTSRRPSGGVAPSTATTSNCPLDQARMASSIRPSSAPSASFAVATRMVMPCARLGAVWSRASLCSRRVPSRASAPHARMVGPELVTPSHLKEGSLA